MKKITLIFILLCTCFFFKPFLKAQVSIYTFSQSMGTYNPISGGILFGNNASDDNVFVNTTNLLGLGAGSTGTGIPIGFNFIFNGISYDRLGINCNGFIFFGQSSMTPAVNSQIGNAYAPISSTSSAQGIQQQKISAFGIDLQGQSTASGIRMEVIGTAPNLTTVVQWSNFRKWNQNGDNFNFQIRLYQTTNIIEVVYGVFVNGTVSGTVQVGLRGQSPNDFNNRFTNAINVWSLSTQGSSATTVANFDNTLLPQNGLTYRWTPPPICVGMPAANNVLASLTTICPGGSSTLSLANTYTNSGITYFWLASTTSSSGGFSSVGTTATLTAANITSSTWYKCAITCSNGGSIAYAGPLLVSTIGSVVSTVPYQEDFESILIGNSLPNCSWATSASTAICQTYTNVAANNRAPHTGTKFAAFKSGTNVNGDYFYTNAVKLNAGITYSASVWYITDGSAGWSNFSILYGSSQSTTGLTSIASVTNSLTNISYQQLSNTFSVTSTGNYFIAIQCIGNTVPQYLSFDDLSVTAPCSANAPLMVLSASSATICNGQTATLSVTGADSYTWTGGINSSSVVVSPSISTTYFVIGSSTLSSCSNTLSKVVTVNPSPLVNIIPTSSAVCAGKTVTLNASPASTYSWDTGATTSYLIVTPIVNSIYTLTATNNFSCQATFTQQIIMLPSPNLTVSLSPTLVCEGASATLYALGADSYEWKANSLYSVVNPVTVSPFVTTTYLVAGSNTLGCITNGSVSLLVTPCVSLEDVNGSTDSFNIFPNPFSDNINMDLNSDGEKRVDLWDALGRLIYRRETREPQLAIETGILPAGIYYITVRSGGGQKNMKIIKQ